MILRFLRKYWGCPPLITSLVLLFGVYLVHKNTELHLRYVPNLVLVWWAICSLIIFVLWDLLAIRKWLQRKEIYIGTAHITITTALAIFLCIAGWIVTRFCLRPEQTTVKYDIHMVACTQEVFEKNIYYYEYVNPLFYGKYLGSEYYGDIFDLSSDPRRWIFYDLEGNVVDRNYEDDLIDAEPTPFEPSSPPDIRPEMKDISFAATYNRENELVFSVSVDDFISNYNALYYEDFGKNCLTPISEWVNFLYDSTPHSPYETTYYRFQQTPGIWAEPTISLYIPTNTDAIQEITLDFDDHRFTEWGYQEFTEECMYVLRLLFPALDENEIAALFNEFVSMAYSEKCFIREEEFEDVEPRVLYYKDDIGIYPYYALGMVHICIIPISQEYLDELFNQDIEVYELFKNAQQGE